MYKKAQNHHFTDQELLQIVKQLISALIHVHSKQTFHRDIKPENILVEGNQIFLCDFGFTAIFGGEEDRRSLCGTRDYLCPEIALKKS